MTTQKLYSVFLHVVFKTNFYRQSQDGGVGGCGVRVSPQLGHLPDAGGGPWHPRGQEEPPSNWTGCGGEWGEGGERRGEEKWRLDGTSTPEGWLGEGRSSHTWRDPQGFGGCGENAASVSPAQSGPGKPAGLPGQVLPTPRPSLAALVLGV